MAILKKSSFIWVTFQKEGIHRYPAAATDVKLATRRFGLPEEHWLDVSFLADPHRHIFHFRVEMEVFHDDRDVEFIQAKRIMERWYNDGTLYLDYKSCEMMANDLYDKLTYYDLYGSSVFIICLLTFFVFSGPKTDGG